MQRRAGQRGAAQLQQLWSQHALRRQVVGEAGPEQQAAALAKARRLGVPVGALAGSFGSLVGVGGGVVISPIIVAYCRSIPQRVVAGTSLAAVLSTALASAATYASAGCLDPGAVLLISPAAMLTAPLGARMTTRLDCSTLRRLLGYFLLCAAPLVPLKAYLLSGRDEGEGEGQQQEQQQRSGGAQQSGTPTEQQQQRLAEREGSGPAASSTEAAASGMAAAAASSTAAATSAAGGAPALAAAVLPRSVAQLAASITLPPPATAALLVATGAVAGVASGLLGIGGGTIVTPLLALSQPYSQATVLGTSLLAMVLPSAAALVQHHRLGNVDWRLAAALALGTAVGGGIGSSVAVQAPPGTLEACFTLGMLLLGRKALQSAGGQRA